MNARFYESFFGIFARVRSIWISLALAVEVGGLGYELIKVFVRGRGTSAVKGH